MSSSEYFNIGRNGYGNNFASPLVEFGKQMTSDAAQIAAAKQRQLQLGIEQQKADYTSPRDLSISPSMMGSVYTPAIDSLSDAARIGSQMRINEAAVMPQKPIYQQTPGGKIKQLDLNKIPQVPAVKTSDNSEPDRGIASDSGIEQLHAAINDFSNGKMAQRMGLEIEPGTGRIHGPGRQVSEYYKLYTDLLNHQASILASSARPSYPQGAQIINPPHDSGAGKDPKKELQAAINAEEKNAAKILTDSSGIKGKLKGMDPSQIKDPNMRQSYDDSVARAQAYKAQLDKLNGVQKIQSSFDKLVTGVMAKHPELSRPQAEDFVKSHVAQKQR